MLWRERPEKKHLEIIKKNDLQLFRAFCVEKTVSDCRWSGDIGLASFDRRVQVPSGDRLLLQSTDCICGRDLDVDRLHRSDIPF